MAAILPFVAKAAVSTAARTAVTSTMPINPPLALAMGGAFILVSVGVKILGSGPLDEFEASTGGIRAKFKDRF